MREKTSCLWWAGRWSSRPASLRTALLAWQWCSSRMLVRCEGGREGGRDGGREGRTEGGREGRTEGGTDGGREVTFTSLQFGY